MRNKKYSWLAVGVILIAANLRLPITMIPPMMPWLQKNLGFPTSLSGLLTTIPLIIFALLSPVIADLGVKKGNAQVLLGTLAILVIGSYLRVIPNNIILVVATILVGIGISGGNVLLPAVIQEYFPRKTVILTSLYTFTMGLVASIGTGVAAPLTKTTSLTMSIALISIFSILAFLVWLVAAYNLAPTKKPTPHNHLQHTNYLLNLPLTWMIVFFFGSQSLLYYSLLTWLPTYWTNNGFSATTSGILATVFQLSGMPLSFLTPIIARTRPGMYFISCLMGGGFGGGVILLLAFQHNFIVNLLIAALLGIAAGASFSMCVVFFQRKTSTIIQTAQISGIAQSFGYLLAACGPILSGIVNQWVHSWIPVFLIYILIAVLMGFDGIMITRHQPLQAEKR